MIGLENDWLYHYTTTIYHQEHNLSVVETWKKFPQNKNQKEHIDTNHNEFDTSTYHESFPSILVSASLLGLITGIF
jgi:hypothetical protein